MITVSEAESSKLQVFVKVDNGNYIGIFSFGDIDCNFTSPDCKNIISEITSDHHEYCNLPMV